MWTAARLVSMIILAGRKMVLAVVNAICAHILHCGCCHRLPIIALAKQSCNSNWQANKLFAAWKCLQNNYNNSVSIIIITCIVANYKPHPNYSDCNVYCILVACMVRNMHS